MTLTDEQIEAIRLEWDGVRGTVPLQKFAMKYIPALLSALEAEKKRADEAEMALKLSEQMMTKASLCNDERLDEGLSVIRRALKESSHEQG